MGRRKFFVLNVKKTQLLIITVNIIAVVIVKAITPIWMMFGVNWILPMFNVY